MTKISSLNKIEEKIKIQFEGEKGIELDTLIASLEYTKTTIKASKNNLPGIENYEIYVAPFIEGSFIVDVTLFVYMATELLPSMVSIGKVFIETIKIWKFLRGREPKEVIRNQNNNTFEITGDNNTVIVVNDESFNTVIDSKKIADNFSTFAKKMNKDNTERGSVNIMYKGENDVTETISIDKDEIKDLSTPVYLRDKIKKSSISITSIVLRVETLEWDDINKWRFSSALGDKPFKATIMDKDFIKNVQEGNISFNSDTRLRVQLKTTETLVEDGSNTKTYEHTIIKVIDVIELDDIQQLEADI